MSPSKTDDQQRRPRGRRRASHSMETVIGEAVALLDEAGESALTFRALAARLGGGVASIYWYVANKDELLDRAADHVLEGVVDKTDALTGSDDPIADLRAIAVALFDAIIERPWLGLLFMRNTLVQHNGLVLYDRIGRQILRLDLPPRESFHAVSAVTGYVVGMANDLGQQAPQELIDSGIGRDAYLARFADQWRALDADEFPFVRYVADEFAVHQDAEQFLAGLDLLLDGLRLQAQG